MIRQGGEDMIFGKQIKVWEAAKILDEGGKVGVRGDLRCYVIENDNGVYRSEGDEFRSLPLYPKYFELLPNNSKFATKDDNKHYYITCDGGVILHKKGPTLKEVEHGNAFTDVNFAKWMAGWTRLQYNLRRFANTNNVNNTTTLYRLVYSEATGNIVVEINNGYLSIGDVYFESREVAEKALEAYGEELMKLINEAPDCVKMK